MWRAFLKSLKAVLGSERSHIGPPAAPQRGAGLDDYAELSQDARVPRQADPVVNPQSPERVFLRAALEAADQLARTVIETLGPKYEPDPEALLRTARAATLDAVLGIGLACLPYWNNSELEEVLEHLTMDLLREQSLDLDAIAGFRRIAVLSVEDMQIAVLLGTGIVDRLPIEARVEATVMKVRAIGAYVLTAGRLLWRAVSDSNGPSAA